MDAMLRWTVAAMISGAATAYAEVAPAPTTQSLPALPGDDAVATQQDQRTLLALPDRALDLRIGRPLEVAVGEVPNVRTTPPSDDKRYDTRREKEWTWQSPQRGTNATGLWPMPSTSGQPGTLQ